MLTVATPLLDEHAFAEPPSARVLERVPSGLPVVQRVESPGIEKTTISTKLHGDLDAADALSVGALLLPRPEAKQMRLAGGSVCADGAKTQQNIQANKKNLRG